MAKFHPHKNGRGLMTTFNAQISKGKLKAAGFCTEDSDNGTLNIKEYEAYVYEDNIILTHPKPISDRLGNKDTHLLFRLKNDFESIDSDMLPVTITAGTVGKLIDVLFDGEEGCCLLALQFDHGIDFIHPENIDWTYRT